MWGIQNNYKSTCNRTKTSFLEPPDQSFRRISSNGIGHYVRNTEVTYAEDRTSKWSKTGLRTSVLYGMFRNTTDIEITALYLEWEWYYTIPVGRMWHYICLSQCGYMKRYKICIMYLYHNRSTYLLFRMWFRIFYYCLGIQLQYQ